MTKKEEIAIKHLKKVDPILAKVIARIPPLQKSVIHTEPFIELVDGIISQQLSTKVASVIFQRFSALFVNGLITPEKVMQLDDQAIRDIGTSWTKASYIKDLASKVVAKELVLDEIAQLSDEDVISELTKVKGIGPWTAEMYLLFNLERPDVFSHGDFGLRKAIKQLYNLTELPTRNEAEKISSAWKPYRSLASRYLWKSLEQGK